MAEIICNIKPGVLKQDIYIKGQKYSNKNTLEKYSLEMEEIPEFIAKQKDIKDVFLGGVSKFFLEKIEYDTKQLEKNLYNKQDTDKIFHYI